LEYEKPFFEVVVMEDDFVNVQLLLKKHEHDERQKVELILEEVRASEQFQIGALPK
jgi:hypothetical protein